MKNWIKNTYINLEIEGMGIVLYSPGMAADIPLGSDFLNSDFTNPNDVGRHIRKGDITGFCTGSPGSFEMHFRNGYPDKAIENAYPLSIRLAIQVVGGEIRVIDLFWLSQFDPDCPEEQVIKVPDGFYHVTLNTRRPASGLWGDKQIIYAHLNKLPQLPAIAWSGVPYLFSE